MKTRVLTIETPALFDAALEQACALLQAGELVVVPTETVYGLAANALDPAAARRIFEVKGRPAYNPLIVHVASLQAARNCASEWPAAAGLLARAFWPGPLTIVVRKAQVIPDLITAGGATVALRWPGHPFMQRLIQKCGFPLAAPSANRSNQLSPTTAPHAVQSLEGSVPLVIDAGPASVGIESTVVDVTGAQPQIFRPGIISAPEIEEVAGALGTTASTHTELRSPGLIAKHYSPQAKLLVRRWSCDEDLLAMVQASGFSPAHVHIVSRVQIPESGQFGRVSVIPDDPHAYARALYAELHSSDAHGARLIVVEEPPGTPEWDGVRDRLKRASAEL